MRRTSQLLIAALLASAVSACNNPPAPQTASHPPAEDLRCQDEPAALTDQQAADETPVADGRTAGEAANDKFNDDALIAGRSCRDALRRSCQWHKDRGAADLDCTPIKPQAMLGAEWRAVASILGKPDPSAARVRLGLSGPF